MNEPMLSSTTPTHPPSTPTVQARPGDNLDALCEAAPAGAVIELAPGEYPGDLFIDHSLTLIGTDVTLRGSGRQSVVTIEGQVAVTLEGLTITGGGGPTGAGICTGGPVDLSLVDCTITGNRASRAGGGLHAGWGRVRLRGGLIADNHAPIGGGVFIADACIATFDDVHFENNRARRGGAIGTIGHTTLTCRGLTFDGNATDADAPEDGGDLLYTGGNGRHTPRVTFEGAAPTQPGAAMPLHTNPEFPGDVRCPAGSEVTSC